MKARLAQMEAEASKLREGQVPPPLAVPSARAAGSLLAPAQRKTGCWLCRQSWATMRLQRKATQLMLRRVRRWTAARCMSGR